MYCDSTKIGLYIGGYRAHLPLPTEAQQHDPTPLIGCGPGLLTVGLSIVLNALNLSAKHLLEHVSRDNWQEMPVTAKPGIQVEGIID